MPLLIPFRLETRMTHGQMLRQLMIREPSQITFALRGGQVVSKMLTYVYIGSVGPFENVYINKNKTKIVNIVNISLFTFLATFEFWCFSIGNFFQVIQSRADKWSTIKSLKIFFWMPQNQMIKSRCILVFFFSFFFFFFFFWGGGVTLNVYVITQGWYPKCLLLQTRVGMWSKNAKNMFT